MTHSHYWPLADLRLVSADLTLRPMAEADLTAVADLLPDDFDLDPAAIRYSGLDDRTNRGVIMHQAYWSCYGRWRPESWKLAFVALADGEIVGWQQLKGEDFPTLRTVDSASFLIPGVRGRGYAKQMRAAVLALAFGPLEAEAAVTSAWHTNHASLGVSRALGYQPNGTLRAARGDGADEMVHLRLDRAGWLASGLGQEVRIEGFDACRVLFGLPPGADDAAAPGRLGAAPRSDGTARVLLISGSTRAASSSTAALRTIQALAPPELDMIMYEGLADLPAFNPDDEQTTGAAVAGLRRQLAAADAVVFCTPEYAGTLPGSMKNLLDWTVGGGELYGKPVAWLNVAGPGRGDGAQATLASVLGYVGATVVEPGCVRLPLGRDAIGPDGIITAPDARATLAGAAREIATFAQASGQAGTKSDN
ncbi:MAG TPA: GNAT family N-acetyltransferase [Streptosporangiaceae bacterium]|jgi:NAD(P)H-dependent FMN reductase/RimJ/RimL family protein N-acetyltransferase